MNSSNQGGDFDDESWKEVVRRKRKHSMKVDYETRLRGCSWRCIWIKRKIFTVYEKDDGRVKIYEAGGTRSFTLELSKREAGWIRSQFHSCTTKHETVRTRYRDGQNTLFIQQFVNARGICIRLWKVTPHGGNFILIPEGWKGKGWISFEEALCGRTIQMDDYQQRKTQVDIQRGEPYFGNNSFQEGNMPLRFFDLAVVVFRATTTTDWALIEQALSIITGHWIEAIPIVGD
ncbi:hypothetical protein Scep_016155 [Stephania cephalantha]|uniref:Uncharacterized protein n=1 Tax=Stephania cephalantha TaxID=152367 RepID=A0AAP0IMB2_9MAGN